MSQQLQQPEHQIIDPETGEVLDKIGYYLAFGLSPGFVIDDEEKMKWYVKQRKKFEAIVSTTKEMYKIAVKRAEAELNEFVFQFHEDAKKVADKISQEEGKQTVLTPYGAWKFMNHKQGSWSIANEDELQTWLRFLPDKLETPEVNGITLPTKELLGVKPATFTRNLEKIKQLCEERRQLQEDVSILQQQNIKPPKELLEKLQALEDILPSTALKYTPPTRTVSISFPKGE